MNFNRHTFLNAIKSLVTGGGLHKDGTTPFDDAGFLKDHVISVGSGSLATGATLGVDSNSQPRISVAATNTGIITYSFFVPRDYDEGTDVFAVRFLANSAGATDTPTVTLTPKFGTVIAAPTAVTAQTTAATTATPQLFELVFRGQGLKRNMLLTLTFTSAAHTTDALLFYGLHVIFHSTLVSYNGTTGAAGRGIPLR